MCFLIRESSHARCSARYFIRQQGSTPRVVLSWLAGSKGAPNSNTRSAVSDHFTYLVERTFSQPDEEAFWGLNLANVSPPLLAADQRKYKGIKMLHWPLLITCQALRRLCQCVPVCVGRTFRRVWRASLKVWCFRPSFGCRNWGYEPLRNRLFILGSPSI